MKEKKRLDQILQEAYPDLTRNQIQSFIIQNKVKVEGKVINKPGTQILSSAKIEVDLVIPKYVCRAGWKLEKALDNFAVDPKDKIILDAGLSTGGFTDCLLQRGAKKVYGVDVGYGQVHEKIRQDPRVIVMERTNLRNLESLPEKVDLVTLDLSFISLLKVIPAVNLLIKPSGELITLIKPQFEAERFEISRGGIVKDPKVHERVIKYITEEIQKLGFNLIAVIESPITGMTGNKEFLAYFKKID